MTNDELIERIVERVPYPAQICEWDTTREGSVRFTWRGTRYRVSEYLTCEKVGDGVLICDDSSILLGALLGGKL